MDISRHRPICGLFPAECQSLRFPAIRGLSQRGKNDRKGRLPILSFLPRRERPLLAGNLYPDFSTIQALIICETSS